MSAMIRPRHRQEALPDSQTAVRTPDATIARAGAAPLEPGTQTASLGPLTRALPIAALAITAALGFSLPAFALTWVTYNGHQYAETDFGLSWAQAEAEALTYGGHLVTINVKTLLA